jgi:hypothetical protein
MESTQELQLNLKSKRAKVRQKCAKSPSKQLKHEPES